MGKEFEEMERKKEASASPEIILSPWREAGNQMVSSEEVLVDSSTATGELPSFQRGPRAPGCSFHCGSSDFSSPPGLVRMFFELKGKSLVLSTWMCLGGQDVSSREWMPDLGHWATVPIGTARFVRKASEHLPCATPHTIHPCVRKKTKVQRGMELVLCGTCQLRISTGVLFSKTSLFSGLQCQSTAWGKACFCRKLVLLFVLCMSIEKGLAYVVIHPSNRTSF